MSQNKFNSLMDSNYGLFMKDTNTIQIKTIKIDDLFNLNKINDIYNFIKSNNSYNDKEIEFNMDDVNSSYINLIGLRSNIKILDLDSEQFKNNIIIFLNELLKKKMVKIIREFNYMANIDKLMKY